MITRYDKDGRAVIGPQEGPQEDFCASTADIVIFGGAAGGGKSVGLLLEAARNVGNSRYNGCIFRRKYKEITEGGGLWDTSEQMYSMMRATGVRGDLRWTFRSGAAVRFNHLNQESTIYDYQGAAFPFLGFDELVHFTRKQFFYLLTRNRLPTGCEGIRPYCRATCNPDADSWVAELIAWWWNPDTGYAIKERSGIIRHFTRMDDEIIWVSPQWRDENGLSAKSITFIASSVEDNPILMLTNPEYRANLQTQDRVTRERLLKGNWLVTYSGGMFRPEWFEIVDELPPGMRLVRYWDMAATEVKDAMKDDPDWTAGALGGVYESVLYIADIVAFREAPGKSELLMKNVATSDGHEVSVYWEEEKGSSGPYTSSYLHQVFKGYDAHEDPVSGSKVERAKPWAAWAEFGRVKLLRGEWNKKFLARAGKFPEGKRDEIDAVSGAFKALVGPKRVFPYYSATADGHLQNFSREPEDFAKIQPHNVEVYVVLWADEDGGIYGGCYLWSKVALRLRLFNEIFHPQPILSRVIEDITQKAVVTLHEKMNCVSVKQVLCNERIQKYGKDNIAKELHKGGIHPRLVTVYDEPGATAKINSMFVQNRIWMHTDCVESDVQWRGWLYNEKKGGKPQPGFPLARCLCLIVSQLRADGTIEHASGIKTYSAEKRQLRERVRNLPYEEAAQSEKEHEWLLH